MPVGGPSIARCIARAIQRTGGKAEALRGGGVDGPAAAASFGLVRAPGC